MNNILKSWDNNLFETTILNTIEDLIKEIEKGTKFEIRNDYNNNKKATCLLEETSTYDSIIYTDEEHPILISTLPILFNNYINESFYKKYQSEIEKAYIQYNEKNNITNNTNRILEQITNENIYIDFNINNNELHFIKNLPENLNFVIPLNNKISDEKKLISINSLNKLNKEITKYNKKCNITINIEELKNRDILLDNMSKEIKLNPNIKIKYLYNTITIKELINIDNSLNHLIIGMHEYNFSPLEKFIYIYNIVKNYKKYKETTTNNKMDSRDIGKILFNDFMVCVGYAHLLKELLRMVDISSVDYHTHIDTSYENGYTKEETPVTKVGHARILVHLKDNKYNLDNYFISDPTWDNDLKNDLYNHMLVKTNKIKNSRRMFYLNKYDLIYDVDNYQDFIKKASYFIKKTIRETENNSILIDKNFIELKAYEDLCETIMNTLKNLDIYSYDDIVKKQSTLENLNDINAYCNLISYAGHIICNKTNKNIDDELLFTSIRKVHELTNNNFNESNITNLINTKLDYDKTTFPYNDETYYRK